MAPYGHNFGRSAISSYILAAREYLGESMETYVALCDFHQPTCYHIEAPHCKYFSDGILDDFHQISLQSLPIIKPNQ